MPALTWPAFDRCAVATSQGNGRERNDHDAESEHGCPRPLEADRGNQRLRRRQQHVPGTAGGGPTRPAGPEPKCPTRRGRSAITVGNVRGTASASRTTCCTCGAMRSNARSDPAQRPCSEGVPAAQRESHSHDPPAMRYLIQQPPALGLVPRGFLACRRRKDAIPDPETAPHRRARPRDRPPRRCADRPSFQGASFVSVSREMLHHLRSAPATLLASGRKPIVVISTVVGQRVRAGDTAARTSSTRGPSEPVPTGIAVPVAKGAVVRGLGRSPAGQGHSPARLGWVRLDVRAGVDAGLERCCHRNRSGPGSRRRRGDRSGGRKLSVPWRTWILTGDMDGSRCRPRSVADGRSERPDQLA